MSYHRDRGYQQQNDDRRSNMVSRNRDRGERDYGGGHDDRNNWDRGYGQRNEGNNYNHRRSGSGGGSEGHGQVSGRTHTYFDDDGGGPSRVDRYGYNETSTRRGGQGDWGGRGGSGWGHGQGTQNYGQQHSSYGDGSQEPVPRDWGHRGGAPVSRDWNGGGHHGSRNDYGGGHRGRDYSDQDYSLGNRQLRGGFSGQDYRGPPGPGPGGFGGQGGPGFFPHPRQYGTPPVMEMQPTFALDTTKSSNNRSYPSDRPSYFKTFYHDNMLGASDDYVSKQYKPKFECKPPPGIDEEGNVVLEKEEVEVSQAVSKKKQRHRGKKRAAPEPSPPGEGPATSSITFISLSTSKAGSSSNPIDIDLKSDSEMSIKDKTEYYNIQLRKEPGNVQLWGEFVAFQVTVFESYEETSTGNDGGKKRAKKGNTRALVEKQISILDKAIVPNPKSFQLQTARLDLMKQIYAPAMILKEWKKMSDQDTSYYFEYLKYSSTEMSIFNTTECSAIVQRAFGKFRLMIGPKFPDFQRPPAFGLVMADLLGWLISLLQAAGFSELGNATGQAQLEVDFRIPTKMIPPNDDAQLDWNEVVKSFSSFWDLGTIRFGEPGAPGWEKVEGDPDSFANASPVAPICVSDTEISDHEDKYLASVQGTKISKHVNWLYMESLRSELNKTPWRRIISDLPSDEEPDSNRIVSSKEVTPFLISIPRSLPNCSSVPFRHLINYILVLHEDFLIRSHTLECIHPYSSMTLTHSTSLFSEVHYHRIFNSLYYSETTNSNDTIPEGFQLSGSSTYCPPTDYSEEVQKSRDDLFNENETKTLDHLRSVIEAGIESLEPTYSNQICQMYFRFLQKSTWSKSNMDPKSRSKIAKTLMKNEKLRSCTGSYIEYALVEWFGGDKAKCTNVLTKTANTSSTPLRGKELDLSNDYELISDLIKVYKLLCEFYLREDEGRALGVLVSLGEPFGLVELSTTPSSKPTSNRILKAKRFLENGLETLLAYDNPKSKSVEELVQKPSLISEWIGVKALFKYLTEGFEEACVVYREALSKVSLPEGLLSGSNRYDESIVNLSSIREHVYINWCKLGAYELSKNPMENSKFRTILGDALGEFPGSPALLLIFTDVEKQSSVAGKLWRQMIGLVRSEVKGDSNSSLIWAPLIMSLGLAKKTDDLEADAEVGQDSFGIGGPAVAPDSIYYKLDALLTASESNPKTRHCPLIWRIHLKHLILHKSEAKDNKRSISLFYEGIRACPSNKALYLDGIRYFPDLFDEIFKLMGEKGIKVRLELEEFELLLQISEEVGKEGEDGDEGDEEKVKDGDGDEDVGGSDDGEIQ